MRADINRLLEVLKTLGGKGLPNVQGRLGRLEQEEADLQQRLENLSQRRVPLARVSNVRASTYALRHFHEARTYHGIGVQDGEARAGVPLQPQP